MTNIIALVATTPRLRLLLENSFASIACQIQPPTAVILVSDKHPLSYEDQFQLREKLVDIPLHVLTNCRVSGAAGSWNSGINFIAQHFPQSYIAILDDDDNWHPGHLSLCKLHSKNGLADLVLSGINVVVNQQRIASNIPDNITLCDFLVGNPGWQGSNTFIKTQVATRVGGFTDGLISSNDRDFAIRVLESGPLQINYTGKVSVDWICNQSADALSAPGSHQKRKGCAQFLSLHGHRMTLDELDQYFQRMETLFKLTRHDILAEYDQLQ